MTVAPLPRGEQADGHLTARWEVAREPQSVPDARDRAQAVLASWNVISDTGDALLMLTELLANAVIHGGGETVVVSLHLHPGFYMLTGAVSDTGREWPRERQGEDDFTEGGRGLSIIACLSTRWGVTRNADGIGKTVWFACVPILSCGECVAA